MPPVPLSIAGITPFSTVDWPGKIAAVCFLAGCPYRCPYCQNADLQSGTPGHDIFDDLLALLEKRRGLLDGVVFSGGEPLVQPALAEAVRAVRDQGFLVGLHTAGSHPERLAQIAPDLAWVGLDVKAPWDAYDLITGVPASGERARASLAVIQQAGIAYECRTTYHPDLLAPADLVTIARDLAATGVETWAVQAYRSLGVSPDAGLRDLVPHASDVPTEARAAVSHYLFREA